MPTWLGPQHASAGCAGAAQPIPPCILLLLKKIVQKQSLEEDKVGYEIGEGTGPGSRPYAPTYTRLADVKVDYTTIILKYRQLQGSKLFVC